MTEYIWWAVASTGRLPLLMANKVSSSSFEKEGTVYKFSYVGICLLNCAAKSEILRWNSSDVVESNKSESKSTDPESES